jgi:hypothetical protein
MVLQQREDSERSLSSDSWQVRQDLPSKTCHGETSDRTNQTRTTKVFCLVPEAEIGMQSIQAKDG